MKRLVLAAFALIVLVAAAQPADVAPLLESQGFFVEDGSDADLPSLPSSLVELRYSLPIDGEHAQTGWRPS